MNNHLYGRSLIKTTLVRNAMPFEREVRTCNGLWLTAYDLHPTPLILLFLTEPRSILKDLPYLKCYARVSLIVDRRSSVDYA